MWVGALEFDLLLGEIGSLKQKRSVVRPLIADVRKRFEDNGLDVVGGTAAEFVQVIKTEIPFWAKIIKEAGIKASE